MAAACTCLCATVRRSKFSRRPGAVVSRAVVGWFLQHCGGRTHTLIAGPGPSAQEGLMSATLSVVEAASNARNAACG
jgi:hypothetical protein